MVALLFTESTFSSPRVLIDTRARRVMSGLFERKRKRSELFSDQDGLSPVAGMARVNAV